MRRVAVWLKTIAVSPVDMLAVAVIGAFWLAYTILCYNKLWLGDIDIYVAGITQINMRGAPLLHEASTQPASDSIIFTPYFISLAALSRAFGLSPFMVLQHAGAFNVGLFVASCVYFFRVFFGNGFIRASAIFLVVCTVLRGRNYSWSSELSLESLALIQAYPSFFAWSSALLCFALARRFLNGGRVGLLLCIGPLLWFTILAHNLSGSWITVVLGMMFLQAFVGGVWPWFAQWSGVALADPVAIRRAVMGGGMIALTIAAALWWPDSNPLSAYGTQPPEEPPFAGTLLTSFPILYALLVPAVFFGLRLAKRLTVFALLGLAGTVAVYLALRASSDYFERYVFFSAFFPQIILAGTLASMSLRGTLGQLGAWRGPALAFMGVTAALVVYSASSRRFDLLRMDPEPRKTFETSSAPLFPAFRDSDVVAACPVTHLTLQVFSHTGARFVLASSSQKGLEREARWEDTVRLFALDASAQEVSAITKKYDITKLLVGRGCGGGVGPALRDRVSEEPESDRGWRVYAVRR